MDKEILFEKATQNLIKQIDTMGLENRERMQAKNFVLLFRDSFKSESVKHATFSQVIGIQYKDFPYDAWGFCKAASCAFVSMMPNPKNWRLMYINEVWEYGPHYYIQHMPSGQVFDLTADQYEYEKLKVPYFMGHPEKINREARDCAVRFTNAIGLDFMQVIKNNKNAKE